MKVYKIYGFIWIYMFLVSFIWISMFYLGEGLYEEQDQADRRSPQLHSAQVGMKEDTTHTSYQVDVFSMVAEIGGYSGLLLGFSLMDTVSVFGHITKWILAPAKPVE